MADQGDRTTSQPSHSEEKLPKKDKIGKGNKWKKKPSQTGSTDKKSEFKGAIAELNGHVFEVGSETTKSNQFARTVEEIGGYMARKYDYGGDIARMLRDEK